MALMEEDDMLSNCSEDDADDSERDSSGQPDTYFDTPSPSSLSSDEEADNRDPPAKSAFISGMVFLQSVIQGEQNPLYTGGVSKQSFVGIFLIIYKTLHESS